MTNNQLKTSRDYLQTVVRVSNNSKYMKWYVQIITRALERQSEKASTMYVERHHILPKSFKLGGETDKNNIAELTAREHFIAHLLLARSFTGPFQLKMVQAVFFLQGNHLRNERFSGITSSTYEATRLQLSKMRAGMPPPILTAEGLNRLRVHNVENNPMANRVEIDGVVYPSVIAAMRSTGMSRYRIDKIRAGATVEEALLNKTTRGETKRGGNSTKKTPVEYEGVTYPSFTAFRKALGVSNTKARKLVDAADSTYVIQPSGPDQME